MNEDILKDGKEDAPEPNSIHIIRCSSLTAPTSGNIIKVASCLLVGKAASQLPGGNKTVGGISIESDVKLNLKVLESDAVPLILTLPFSSLGVRDTTEETHANDRARLEACGILLTAARAAYNAAKPQTRFRLDVAR